MSALTWLDYSDAERRRALQILDLLSVDQTRDELGLGTIRDAFADAMFPGISTIQRRARYFLFVPWIYREIEEQYGWATDLLDRGRKRELDLIEVLLKGDDRDGLIGGRVRGELRQLPSMIYWQGLGRWGIREREGTREQWRRAIRTETPAARDDDLQTVDGNSWWHAGLPSPPNGWPGQASLALTTEEATYLRERIADTCEGSLLATLVMRENSWQPTDFPWELEIAEANAGQRRVVAFARRFSETMNGAALLYNHMLAVAREDEAREVQYREDLDVWAAAETTPGRQKLDLAELWDLLDELRSRHKPNTQGFVERWFAIAENPAGVADSANAQDLIRRREHDVKHRQARLSYDAALETWRGAAGVAQLSYRWPTAQRQLLDIISATES
jgi:hypothetical protein